VSSLVLQRLYYGNATLADIPSHPEAGWIFKPDLAKKVDRSHQRWRSKYSL